MSLNVEFVREQFPALNAEYHSGQAHFENAGGSFMCRQVANRLYRYVTQRRVQPYGAYPLSRLAGEEMDKARRRLAGLLRVSPNEVNFGPSTSQNTYVLARALAASFSHGDTIVVTEQDHEANSGVWRKLDSTGVEIREWKINAQTGQLCVNELGNLLDQSVRLVCFPHASNVVGEINPVRKICDLAHEVGALTCVDGVSFAPHTMPDISELQADIYLFSGYKTYGPHQGIMVLRNDLAERMENQGHYFNAAEANLRLTPSGPDHAQIAACAGIADYFDCLHEAHTDPESNGTCRTSRVNNLFREHEIRLSAVLLEELKSMNGIRLIGPTEPDKRVPTFSIAHERPASELAQLLSDHGIMCGGGHYYAVRCLQGLGVDPNHGVLRLSVVHYNTEAEIHRLVEALEAVL